jgi:hypothetical protein
MRRALDTIYDAAAYLAAAFVLAIFVVMVGGSAMRIAGLKTGGSDDIVAWCCAAAGFLAMAHTFRRGDFVRVTLLLERLTGTTRRVVEIVCLAIATRVRRVPRVGRLLVRLRELGFPRHGQRHDRDPLWIPQASFALARSCCSSRCSTSSSRCCAAAGPRTRSRPRSGTRAAISRKTMSRRPPEGSPAARARESLT